MDLTHIGVITKYIGMIWTDEGGVPAIGETLGYTFRYCSTGLETKKFI